MHTRTVGNVGERIVCWYLTKLGFRICGRNVAYATGELDIVAYKAGSLHIVEVKAARCHNFPVERGGWTSQGFDPAQNLHAAKLRKVVRTAEWHVSRIGWAGEWQVDGALVWIRRTDGMARVRYYPGVA